MDELDLEWFKQQFAQILKEVHIMVVTQSQMDTDLATLTAAVQTLIGKVNKLIALVQSPGDFTSEDTGINAATAAANTAIAAAKAVTGS